MKKELLLIIAICAFLGAFSQNKKENVKNTIESPKSFKVYYAPGHMDEKSVFETDTLFLSQDNSLPNRLDLVNDSVFCFQFDFTIDTVTVMNANTGELTTMVVPDSNKQKCGRWKYYNDQKNIKFITDDQLKFKYLIRETEEGVLFIKVENCLVSFSYRNQMF